MQPWRIAGELLQELRRGDHSGGSSARVWYVRDVALDEISVFIIHRHLPHFLARAFCDSQKGVDEGLIVPHDAHTKGSQSDPCRPCERGEIDHVGGSKTSG